MAIPEHLIRTNELPPTSVTVSSEKGKRSYQEDRYLAEVLEAEGHGKLEVLAIMDGHGGAQLAELVRSVLIDGLKTVLQDTTELPKAIQKFFTRLNSATEHMDPGSTLSLVIIPQERQRAYVAILGDSPVIIRDKDGKICVSPEHNARVNPVEREAAIKRGAYWNGHYLVDKRSGDCLQMSRSLGDEPFASFLNREPEIYEIELDGDSFIIAASDGVFDPTHLDIEEEISRLAKMVAEGAGASELVRDAIERQTGDNATAIVWRAS